MKLFFRKLGEGPPLIILHGLYGSSDNWITIAKKISSIYTVILPDQRNHGESPHSEVHDYESMSNDLHELAETLGLKRFFLAGHSMGGKTATLYAVKWPEMIEGLLIADISPFSGTSVTSEANMYHYSILKAVNEIALQEIKSRSDADRLLAERIKDEKVRGFLLKNLKREIGNQYSWKINVQALLANIGKITEPLHFNEFLQVTGFPVTMLKGGRSDYVTEEDFKEFATTFPAAELKVIGNAGHWLHADNPDAVCLALAGLAGKTV
jgi:esterase